MTNRFKLIAEKIEIALILSCLLYVFSPLASMKSTSFFQGIKAGESICLLGFCLLFMFVRRLYVEKNFLFKLSSIDVIVLIYGVFLLILAISSWSELDREVVLRYVACGLLYVMARNIRVTWVRLLLLVFPLLLFWQLWYGIAEQTFYFYPGRGVDLVHGSFLNTGIWSCFVACVVVVTCGSLELYSSWWTRVCLGMVIVVAIGLLWVGNSRAAWVGFAFGGGYLLYQRIKRGGSVHGWLMSVVFVGMLVGAGIYTAGKVYSALGRLLIWKVSGSMCLDRPWGFGLDGFRRYYMGYQEEYFSRGGSDMEKMLGDETMFAFNEILRVMVEQGVIGLGLLTLLLYVIFFGKSGLLAPGEVKLYRVVKGVLLVWLVFALFSYPSQEFQAFALFFLFLALLSSFRESVVSVNGKWVFWISGVLWILMITREVIPYHKAVRDWDMCLEKGHVPVEWVKSRLLPLMNAPYFLSNSALLLNKAREYQMASLVADRGVQLYGIYACLVESGIALEHQGEYMQAERMWVRAGNAVPNRFRPIFLRMEMWYARGNVLKAAELAGCILNKKVKIRSPELSWMLRRSEIVKQIKTESL